MALTPDQFIRKWADTHTELALTNGKRPKQSVKFPEDRNISSNKKIPGKNLIEKKAMEYRENKLSEMLHDAVEVRSKDLLEQNPLQIIDRIVKLNPPSQRIQQEITGAFTFADMVKRATIDIERMKTTDIVDAEVIDDSEDN